MAAAHRCPRPALPAALALGALVAADATLAQQPFDVALRDGLLSIRANEAPLGALAEALSGETGVSFVVTGDAGQPITTEIVEEPLVSAIEMLSPNHLLVRADSDPDAPVIEVVLMFDDDGAGGGGDTRFLPSGAPAEEVFAGESPAAGELAPPESLADEGAVDGSAEFADVPAEFDGADPLGADPETYRDGELRYDENGVPIAR